MIFAVGSVGWSGRGACVLYERCHRIAAELPPPVICWLLRRLDTASRRIDGEDSCCCCVDAYMIPIALSQSRGSCRHGS